MTVDIKQKLSVNIRPLEEFAELEIILADDAIFNSPKPSQSFQLRSVSKVSLRGSASEGERFTW